MSVFLNYKKSPIPRGESSYKQYKINQVGQKEVRKKKEKISTSE